MENEEYSKQKIRECADGRAALALSPYISHNCWISSGDEGNQRRHRALMFHCPLGKSSAGAYHAIHPHACTLQTYALLLTLVTSVCTCWRISIALWHLLTLLRVKFPILVAVRALPMPTFSNEYLPDGGDPQVIQCFLLCWQELVPVSILI